MRQASRRRAVSNFVVTLCGLAVVLALIPLVLIFIYVIKQGFSSLNWDFFTKMPKPVGEPGGGMANAMLGTLWLIAIAALFAIPVGIIAGVGLSVWGLIWLYFFLQGRASASDRPRVRAAAPAGAASRQGPGYGVDLRKRLGL